MVDLFSLKHGIEEKFWLYAGIKWRQISSFDLDVEKIYACMAHPVDGNKLSKTLTMTYKINTFARTLTLKS
jgi:hypothetical protein